MDKIELIFNKSIYVGMSILDLLKSLMYNFHYNYIKPNIRYQNTDTGSLMYVIKTDDFYKDIELDIKTKFNTSNFPDDHKGVKQRVNKKVIGMMKNETGGDEITEFVGLRAKLYNYKMIMKK